jgi:hypothetical protein
VTAPLCGRSCILGSIDLIVERERKRSRLVSFLHVVTCCDKLLQDVTSTAIHFFGFFVPTTQQGHGKTNQGRPHHETKQHDRVGPHVSRFHRGVLQHFHFLERQPFSFQRFHSLLHVRSGNGGFLLAHTNSGSDQFRP